MTFSYTKLCVSEFIYFCRKALRPHWHIGVLRSWPLCTQATWIVLRSRCQRHSESAAIYGGPGWSDVNKRICVVLYLWLPVFFFLWSSVLCVSWPVTDCLALDQVAIKLSVVYLESDWLEKFISCRKIHQWFGRYVYSFFLFIVCFLTLNLIFATWVAAWGYQNLWTIWQNFHVCNLLIPHVPYKCAIIWKG